MRRPPALKPGDRIAIVAPASPFERAAFDAGLVEIERLGFVPVFDQHVFDRDGYLAGSAVARAASFMRHWSDDTVAALLAARGGYGSVQLLPLLDLEALVRRPKLFIGYSDTTSLLSWLTCQGGMTALHGPMVEGRLSEGAAGYDRRTLLALAGGGVGLELAPDGLATLRDGVAEGILVGGTLTQLTASMGTPFAFDPPEGCVLFLEDVNERPYRLDRMLMQLRLGGVLGRARALVFGEMRDCDEPGGAVRARDVIERTTRDFDGPVLYGFPSGHTTGPTWTLPLGVSVRVESAPHPRLVVKESAVE